MNERMNVLYIISDQHRADHMSCAGNPILKTPNLDKLANKGVRFTSAFVANPICMPNRSSIFKDLRYQLIEQLLFENLKAQSRYPKREALS